MKVPEERQLYLIQRIKNIAYNTKYNILKYFEGYGKGALNNQVYILGKKIIIPETNRQQIQKQIYSIFSSTPWITYRSGFPKLINQKTKTSYVSDTGWGCMVRVGQMLFAEIIKHYKKMTNKTQILDMLTFFSDVDKTQPFSIHKIAQMAKQEYGLQPGQWYNPSHISYILKRLFQINLQQSYKLKILVFNTSNIYFDTITEEMLSTKKTCKCSPTSPKFICPTCNTAQNEVAIIVLSRLGLQGPQQKYIQILSKLMELQFCQGVIGGKPEKALYFIGKQNQHFIYLDPHYVQSVQKNQKRNNSTYFCQSFRMCKKTSIDTSIGISFYLRDIQQFNIFYSQIQKIKTEYQQNFFIFLSDEVPTVASNDQGIQIVSSNENIVEIA